MSGELEEGQRVASRWTSPPWFATVVEYRDRWTVLVRRDRDGRLGFHTASELRPLREGER